MNCHYDIPFVPTDTNFGVSKVDRSTYVSAERQIKSIMSAGRNYKKALKEQYDGATKEALESAKNDPTRSSNFDRVSASQLFNLEVERLSAISSAPVEAGNVGSGEVVETTSTLEVEKGE